MLINGITIDDKKLREARMDFRLSKIEYHSRGKLSFNKILDRLTRRRPLAEIAKEDKTTSGGMSWKYKRFFCDLLEETGLQYRTACSIERRAAKAREIPNEGILAFVMREAESLGYDAKRVQRSQRSIFLEWQVILQGKLCLLHHLTFTSSFGRKGKQECGRLEFRNFIEYDFRIVITDFPDCPRRIFIFPASIFSDSGMCYLPTKQVAVYRNGPPAIDVWQYENAWHQLPEPIKT